MVMVDGRSIPARARRRRRLTMGLLAVCLLATACVTDLTSEVGTDGRDYAGFVNDDGVMVGRSSLGLTRFDPQGAKVHLEDPPGDAFFYQFQALNNAREVLGLLADSNGFPGVWNAAGEFTDLRPFIPGIAPGVWAQPVDINEHGDVVGYLFGWDETTSPPTQAQGVFVVNVRERRGFLVPAEVTGDRPVAYAINDAGMILASVGYEDVKLVPEGGTYVIERLPYFSVHGFNNAGDVVGNDSYQAAVWKRGQWAPTRLRTPDALEVGLTTRGMINDAGMIIFNTEKSLDVPGLPARWVSATEPYTLFPADGWQGATMHDLNEKGEAVGYATRADGEKRPVRWN